MGGQYPRHFQEPAFAFAFVEGSMDKSSLYGVACQGVNTSPVRQNKYNTV